MSNYNGEALVERIRRICKSKGVSIAQMEKDLKWSQGLISRWTKSSPSVGKILDVVTYLGSSFEELFGEIELKEVTHHEEKTFSEKLYEVTQSGGFEWRMWDEEFEHEEIKALLDGGQENRVYYTPYENSFFLLLVNREDIQKLQIGVLSSEKGKIVYQQEDTEKWMEALLGYIDPSEYEIWNNTKTKYIVEQFMRTDF